MVLNKATDVVSLPDEKGKLYRFVVTCGETGRAFEIKASDQRTKSEWIHAIKEVRTYICSYVLIYVYIRTYVYIYATLSHLRSKESMGIHKPCIPALLSYQGYI